MEPIYAQLDHGGPVKLLFVVNDEFSGLDLPALWEDMKAAGSVGLKHRSAWETPLSLTRKESPWRSRLRLVCPGELRVFGHEQLSEATSWLASSTTSRRPRCRDCISGVADDWAGHAVAAAASSSPTSATKPRTPSCPRPASTCAPFPARSSDEDAAAATA